MEKILLNARKLYNYLNISCDVKKSDIILGLGCMDIGIPNKCTSLYKNDYGKLVVFSGNVGKGTDGVLQITEAERFKKIATSQGMEEAKILLEKQATNTYENFKYTKRILEKMNYDFDSIIIVQKPYVKRRCLAIADIELQGKKYYITSEDLSFEEFIKQSEANKTMSIDEIINEIVGEISIILEAPKYNIQSSQQLGKDILDSYKFLINAGYTKYIITEEKIRFVIDKWNKLGL